jgi:hypothetical protein
MPSSAVRACGNQTKLCTGFGWDHLETMRSVTNCLQLYVKNNIILASLGDHTITHVHCNKPFFHLGGLLQVSYAESEFAAYTKHKYCVGLNSCGSAIFLALWAAGVRDGDTVLSNALTFNAVPSAIHHARAHGLFSCLPCEQTVA